MGGLQDELLEIFQLKEHGCQAEFDIQKIQKWITLVEHCSKNITIDGRTASAQDIIDRLNSLWLQDETILYIGKAGPNRRRTLKKG